MSENRISVSNTPIFDALEAERGYDPKFPPHLVKPFQFRSVGMVVHAVEGGLPQDVVSLQARGFLVPEEHYIVDEIQDYTGIRANPEPEKPASYDDVVEAMQKLPPPRPNVELVVKILPEDIVDGSPEALRARGDAVAKEFIQNHPHASNVTVSTMTELDGSIMIRVFGYEKPGVTLAKPLSEFFDWERTGNVVKLLPKTPQEPVSEHPSLALELPKSAGVMPPLPVRPVLRGARRAAANIERADEAQTRADRVQEDLSRSSIGENTADSLYMLPTQTLWAHNEE